MKIKSTEQFKISTNFKAKATTLRKTDKNAIEDNFTNSNSSKPQAKKHNKHWLAGGILALMVIALADYITDKIIDAKINKKNMILDIPEIKNEHLEVVNPMEIFEKPAKEAIEKAASAAKKVL